MKKAIKATEVVPPTAKTMYPKPFAQRVEGRTKRKLGDFFGITKFGINHTELAPNSESALFHKHSKQEEFIYILEGQPTLILDDEEIQLSPGMCAGFTPNGSAHQLVNRTNRKVVYIEIGDREAGDQATYPRDDLIGHFEDGKWTITHKDGTPY